MFKWLQNVNYFQTNKALVQLFLPDNAYKIRQKTKFDKVRQKRRLWFGSAKGPGNYLLVKILTS